MRDEISAVRDRRYRSGGKVYPRFRTDRMTAQASFRSASRECHLGIPAANHDPDPADRMRSTGLVQGFGGAGESVSSMRKSPFTSRGTPAKLELCWTFPSLAQNSVAKTLAFALLPTALPEPRRSPRPPSRMLPSCFTVPYHPNLASGRDASDRSVCGTSGNNANPSVEPHQVLGQGRLSDGYHDENHASESE